MKSEKIMAILCSEYTPSTLYCPFPQKYPDDPQSLCSHFSPLPKFGGCLSILAKHRDLSFTKKADSFRMDILFTKRREYFDSEGNVWLYVEHSRMEEHRVISKPLANHGWAGDNGLPITSPFAPTAGRHVQSQRSQTQTQWQENTKKGFS